MIKKTYRITSENGLHARPATMLVNCTVKYESDAYISCGRKKVDLKSIMGVMSLGVYVGDVVTFEINGKDEEECMKKINEVFFQLSLGKEV